MKYILLFFCFIAGFTTTGQIYISAPDSVFRFGKLANGMTYYIKQNKLPRGAADFEIFHSVGAIQEEDHQNGLAHFLEHQAFRGLKHFPGKTMTNYLETIGVKFGANLNAQTATDYTRYLINNVPLLRQGVIDTFLLILSDWSGSILASQEDIDAERNVVKEEWRMRGGLGMRINDALAPVYFKNSKYALRSIIGDMDVIDNFSRNDLLEFYHKWYRPEFQAIAIAGDFDIDKMEKDVIKTFSELQPSAPAPRKQQEKLPGNKKLIYGFYVDKEAPNSAFTWLFKQEKPDAESIDPKLYFTWKNTWQIIASLMNQRWYAVSHQQDLPVISLQYSYGTFVADQNVFAIDSKIKSGQQSLQDGIDKVMHETERIRRFGFLPQELESVKSNFKNYFEKQYLERHQKTNDAFINDYFAHFIKKEPILNDEERYAVINRFLDTLSVGTVNNAIRELLSGENQIVTLVTSKEDSIAIPAYAAMSNKLERLSRGHVADYNQSDNVEIKPSRTPEPGAVLSSLPEKFGAVLWTLSNGAKVYILPTGYKQDEVLMNVYAKGGHSNFNDSQFLASRFFSLALGSSGVGDLNPLQLHKALSGKSVKLQPYLGEFSRGFDGSSSSRDFETMLKLVYMYFTEPRFDNANFNLEKNRYKETLINRAKNPFAPFQDTIAVLRGNKHFRTVHSVIKPQDVEAANITDIEMIYRSAFDNPGDFTYMITGAVDTNTIKPLIEKYIGGLSGVQRKAAWKDNGIRSPRGEKTIALTQAMETPKAVIFMENINYEDYSFRKSTAMFILQGVLDIRFNKVLRDEHSGVYSVSVEAAMDELPKGKMKLIVSFETDPANLDSLESAVRNELNRLATEGIGEQELQKSKEYMSKSFAQNVSNNHYWKSILYTYATTGQDVYTTAEKMLSEISDKEITAMLKRILDAGNLLTVKLLPE